MSDNICTGDLCTNEICKQDLANAKEQYRQQLRYSISTDEENSKMKDEIKTLRNRLFQIKKALVASGIVLA